MDMTDTGGRLDMTDTGGRLDMTRAGGCMDLTELRATVRDADAVVAVGGRTQWEVGGAVAADAVEVRAPAGVIRYEPADLTITVGAGTRVADLDAVLAEHGQECPLDPRDADATVGGVLSAGLSGLRRLRHGPVRDRVLEVRVVTADGRVVKGGGPTVKNVSGYDLPRLLVGSLGTIGVLAQVTLRAQPRPATSTWATTRDSPSDVRARLFRPSCIAWDGSRTCVLLEGHPADVDAQLRAAGLTPVDEQPALPDGPHRGRISIPPGGVAALGPELDVAGVRWLAEVGVGTVHVAAEDEAALAAARRCAAGAGGWLLREAGAPGLDPFGLPFPNGALLTRIKRAFDPTGKLGPGRLPIAGPYSRPPLEVERS